MVLQCLVYEKKDKKCLLEFLQDGIMPAQGIRLFFLKAEQSLSSLAASFTVAVPMKIRYQKSQNALCLTSAIVD